MDLPGTAPTRLFGLAPPGLDNSVILSTSAGDTPLPRAPASAAPHEQHKHGWSPYDFNGGTSLGIAGDDFAVIAADTRLSEGYSILTRRVSRSKVLSPKCVIATGGCHTDVLTLHKVLATATERYALTHGSTMATPALAQLLSTTLYGRRFMPYYAFNVVAGLDAAGRGAVFTYDAVGSYERVAYAAQGSGQKLIIPLLDNIVGGKNRRDRTPPVALTEAEAVALAIEAFVTAGEREMMVGDAVEIFVINAAGTRRQLFELKRD